MINQSKINPNLNWRYITDHLYRILIINSLGSGRTYVLLNIIKSQSISYLNRKKSKDIH